ncbi:calcium-binding protein [Pseudomonas citrulli]|uniref:Calcium-binding protein n=1 Tax=Pseudomonas citrulli TaxID=3064347 RepID=A0ABT9C323_9PSED|nr:calcium-binding protein [Pseudomonas sp. K18]MDO7897612.1 calcium-binding protein [Pseudomonas sp. K18]
MAQVFHRAFPTLPPSVIVTELDAPTTAHTADTLAFETADPARQSPEHRHRRARLDVVDKLHGPLPIGASTVTRVALDGLGATIDGHPLTGENTFFHRPNRFFLDALQLDAADIETRLSLTTDADDYRLTTLLFELATQRSPTAPPLLKVASGASVESKGYRGSLEKLLGAAQKIQLEALAPISLGWVSRAKSSLLIPTGLGLQAFGIYSGLRGLQDAIRNKDAYQTLFNGASVAGEVASIGVEAALTRQASQMIKAGERALGGFSRTSFAVGLGRASGLIASVLTLPFDIIAAIDSFKAAASATGRQATDHYVSAALSITSATLTLAIGTAALAGFSAAGPVGLAAGLILAVGAQVWGAIREVDEIDDYITLTAHERLRTGWLAFWTLSPDPDIQDRYLRAKASVEHERRRQADALNLLKGTLKDSTEAIVNGRFTVELEQVTYNTRSWWTGEPYQATTVRPRIKDSDDSIDARAGVTVHTPGAVIGSSAGHKAIHWHLGDGHDTVVGPVDKPNVFHYGAGTKRLTGGARDDVFIFEGSTQASADERGPSRLDGGEGRDTLVLAGRARHAQERRIGYHVDLEAGQLSFITGDPETPSTQPCHAVLDSIEQVEILEGGTNVIKGSAGSNLIKSRGNDSIEAGAGDDQVFLLGANNRNADGGPGDDTYAIAHKPGRVTITEDGMGHSVIALDWRADLIDRWHIADGSLVVTSGFDSDDWPVREVVINGVYRGTAYPRTLQNDKLTFVTRDGYHLLPDLPGMLENERPLDIECVMVQQGTPRNPLLLDSRKEHVIAPDRDTSYCVSRLAESTTLAVKRKTPFSTTLHLDYARSELTRIEAHYNAHVTQHEPEQQIKYGECGLTLYFGTRRLVLKNLASSDERYSARAAGSQRRVFSVIDSHQVVLLTMNDGTSYRLSLPSPDYGRLLDETLTQAAPVQWTAPVPQSLTPTRRQYPFLPPRHNVPHDLGPRPSCALLTTPSEQSGIEVLRGEGATYLVHLSPGMTLRLTTPGALAGARAPLSNASIWELDATRLGPVEIKLSANRLQLAGTIIHLPDYGPDDLVDPIRVITQGGVVYAVDALFETVYVKALDGRYFWPPVDPDADLPSELAGLNAKVLKVRNLALKDGSPGALSYHLDTRQWTLETEPSRVIDTADLKITHLCDHHLAIYQDLAREGLNQTPPLNDSALRLLREKCVELSESFPLKRSMALAQAVVLSAALGLVPPLSSGWLSVNEFLAN